MIKKIHEYFEWSSRRNIFRFWLQSVAGVVILWSEDSSRGDQRSGDWRTKTASTPPASGLSSTQSGHSPPLQHITDRLSAPVRPTHTSSPGCRLLPTSWLPPGRAGAVRWVWRAEGDVCDNVSFRVVTTTQHRRSIVTRHTPTIRKGSPYHNHISLSAWWHDSQIMRNYFY